LPKYTPHSTVALLTHCGAVLGQMMGANVAAPLAVAVTVATVDVVTVGLQSPYAVWQPGTSQ
jgi:hypothetical protein